jgi:hypothetical protein
MSIVLLGSTSGSCTLQEQAVAGTTTLTLPTTSGTVALTSNLQEIGVSQTWQDLIGSRTSGTTYTNSTGKPIMVAASSARTGDVARLTIAVDGVTIGSAYTGTSSLQQIAFMTTIVPNGSTYVVTAVAGSLTSWTELR